MVFKVPNKEQINFARSAFREIVKALDNQRVLKGPMSSTEQVLPELYNAVTKPNVDPRKLALDIVRTGRVGGKKVSSNQRREIATINDYVNNVIKSSEELGNVPPFITYRQKQMYNPRVSNLVEEPPPTFYAFRPITRLLSKYENKLSEGELSPNDINNINALLTMKGMKAMSIDPFYIPRGVQKKFLPAPVRGNSDLRLSDYITGATNQYRAINKLKNTSGKAEFENKMYRGPRSYLSPYVSDVLMYLDRLGIPRSQEIDDMIITLLPEWEGSAEDFVNMIRSLEGI